MKLASENYSGTKFEISELLFDEFGRFIEYTAANPTIAGDAALQQIFEAVQTANGKIIFAGFIQNELKAYLSRIEKTANITRYIDRYRTACENLFLSSNFETILANILKKSGPEFDRLVENAIGHYNNYHTKIQSALSRWDRSAVKKSVWVTPDLYKSVILKGCYPLHPITVWLLSGSHQWMQQRSTLAFVAEMFDQVSSSEIDSAWLPYIYPVQLIDSGIFNEMLNSEEKGLVSSQYCMLYRDIFVKIGDKLSDLEKTILKAVLIVNMGRMAFRNKDDAIMAIRYCSNVTEDEVKHALKSLEEMHGVVAFDEHAKTYDLIAEANGFNEFKRIFAKYRLGVKSTIGDLDEAVLSQISLTTPVDTSFGQALTEGNHFAISDTSPSEARSASSCLRMVCKASFSHAVPINDTRSSKRPYSGMRSMFLRKDSGLFSASQLVITRNTRRSPRPPRTSRPKNRIFIATSASSVYARTNRLMISPSSPL